MVVHLLLYMVLTMKAFTAPMTMVLIMNRLGNKLLWYLVGGVCKSNKLSTLISMAVVVPAAYDGIFELITSMF